MPDGIVPPTETSALELAADAADSRLVRHVRRNLVLWSGGTTLVILLVLAAALYVAVAGSLANRSIEQFDARLDEVNSALTGQRPAPDDSGPYGFIFGGGGSGTVALALDGNDRVLAPRGFHIPPGLPDMDGVKAARTKGRDVRTGSLTSQGSGPGGSARTEETPVRVLTENVTLAGGSTFTVQIVGDRIAEERTLQVMLVVLLVGGMVVVLVAFGFGALYARRALVPIRESLTNQRTALRRQREFAADASHELRTPLTVIRSSVEHLARHRDEPVAAVGSALEDIDDEVRHMTSIVEDLLLLARSDSGAVALEHVPVDLGDVAADGASAMGKPATDRGVRVEVDPQPAVVAGDPARLRQLVDDPGRQRHPPQPGRWSRRRRRPGERCRGISRGRGRRAGHPSGGPAARLRALLPRARRAGRGHRPRAGDRGLDRGSARRPDRGCQSGRGRGTLRREPAGHRRRRRLIPRRGPRRSGVKITSSLHRLGSSLVNSYLVEEGGLVTILDAGLPGYWGDLPTELAAMGRSLDDVRAVVLTHGDTDHVGFAERLRRERGVPVYVHELDAGRARGEVKKPNSGWGPVRIRPLVGFLLYSGRRGGLRIPPLTDVVTFDDDATLDVPGSPRVIHTPGHTPGSVALHVPGADAIVVGDALTTRSVLTGEMGPRLAPFTLEPAQALSALTRLDGLDVTWVLPGHGEAWGGGLTDALREIRAAAG